MSHQLKKHLGQHFLKEPAIAERIANTLQLYGQQYDTVVEIGPGQGVMTEFLLNKYGTNLHLVEIDDDLIPYLTKKFSEISGQIHHIDFLQIDLNTEFSGSYAITGNFPYNISSQIVFKVVENRHKIPEMSGMFQREVALRLCAEPDGKVYGLISAWVQAFYDCEYLFTVNEGSFNPPPKVKSGVIRLTRKLDYDAVKHPALLLNVIKAAFNMRRKTLRNSLHQYIPFMNGVDPEWLGKRAENLSAKQFIKMTEIIHSNTTAYQQCL